MIYVLLVVDRLLEDGHVLISCGQMAVDEVVLLEADVHCHQVDLFPVVPVEQARHEDLRSIGVYLQLPCLERELYCPQLVEVHQTRNDELVRPLVEAEHDIELLFITLNELDVGHFAFQL